MGRRIPGNARVTTALVYDPDPFSVQAASLGLVTSTYSPASAGVHSPGAGTRGFVGDPGFGVNRSAGAGGAPMQHFRGAIAPIALPDSQRLGLGAGVSGQPGLPSTGDLTGSLGWTYGLPGIGPGMGG